MERHLCLNFKAITVTFWVSENLGLYGKFGLSLTCIWHIFGYMVCIHLLNLKHAELLWVLDIALDFLDLFVIFNFFFSYEIKSMICLYFTKAVTCIHSCL